MRSLARDMGRDLGCFGHIATLRRTEVDPFTADDLISVDALIAASPRQDGKSDDEGPSLDFSAVDALLLNTSAALEHLPQIALTDDAATRIRLGNSVIVRGRDAPVDADDACATLRGRLVAIGAVEAGMFNPKRVFAG